MHSLQLVKSKCLEDLVFCYMAVRSDVSRGRGRAEEFGRHL